MNFKISLSAGELIFTIVSCMFLQYFKLYIYHMKILFMLSLLSSIIFRCLRFDENGF